MSLLGGLIGIGGGMFANRSAKKMAVRQENARQNQYRQERSDNQEDAATARANYNEDEARIFERGTDQERKLYERSLDDVANQYSRLRDAAEAGGFNPLSVLGTGQAPASGGVISGGAQGFKSAAALGQSGFAPLSSIDMITGGLQEVADAFDGTVDAQEENLTLRNELMRIELDQHRSGVYTPKLGPNRTGLPSSGSSADGAPLGSKAMPGTVGFEQPSGNTVYAPSGGDLDERLTGAYDRTLDWWRDPSAYPDGPFPNIVNDLKAGWDKRFGPGFFPDKAPTFGYTKSPKAGDGGFTPRAKPVFKERLYIPYLGTRNWATGPK